MIEVANDNRPPEFDARVMQYLPGLKKMAAKRVPRIYSDDLVTDTIMSALENWKNFREDGGMWSWLVWQMRGVLSNQAQHAARRKKNIRFIPIEDHMVFEVPPAQIDHVELSQTVDSLNSRDGAILLRRAMTDDSMEAIGQAYGISKERVRQIEAQQRERLKARDAA